MGLSLLRECEGNGNAVSSIDDVLEINVVRGVRGVG